MMGPYAEVELVRIDPEKAPLARWGHTATLIAKELFVFGGYGANETHLNSIDIFNTDTLGWTHFPGDGNSAPEGRDSHSASAVGPNIFILGGTTGTANIPFDDISVFNTHTRAWFKASSLGTIPTPREGHTATCVGERIFVFGGSFSSQAFNDVCVYDTKSQSWSSASAHGKPPPPRDSHTATLVKNRFIFVFGGDTGSEYCNDLHVLDTQTMSWMQPRLSGQPPSPRAGHVAALVDQHSILICGGGSEEGSLNDLHVLDTKTYTWMEVSTAGTGWMPRFGHTAAVISATKVLIFGGNDGSKPLNDISLVTFYADMGMAVVKSEEDAGGDALGAPLLNYALPPPANGLLARARDAAAGAGTASPPNQRAAAQQPWQHAAPVAVKEEEPAIVRTYTLRLQRPSEELVRTLQGEMQRLGFSIFKPNNTFFSARKDKKPSVDSSDAFSGVSTVLYTSGALVVQGFGKEAFITSWLTPLLTKIGVKWTIDASQPRSKRADEEGGADGSLKAKRMRRNKAMQLTTVGLPSAAPAGVQTLRSLSLPHTPQSSEPSQHEGVVLPLLSNPGAFEAGTEFRGSIDSVFELGYFASVIVNGHRFKAMLVRGSNARPTVRELPSAAVATAASSIGAAVSAMEPNSQPTQLDRNIPLSLPPKPPAAMTYSGLDQAPNAAAAAGMQAGSAGYSLTSPFLKPPLAQAGRPKPPKESLVEKNIYRAASSYLPPCPPQTASGGSVNAKLLQNPYSVHNVPLPNLTLPLDHSPAAQQAAPSLDQHVASLDSAVAPMDQQRQLSDVRQVHAGDAGGHTPFSTQYHAPSDQDAKDDALHDKKPDDGKDGSVHQQHNHSHQDHHDPQRHPPGGYYTSRGDASSTVSLFRAHDSDPRVLSKTSAGAAYQGDVHGHQHPNATSPHTMPLDYTTPRTASSFTSADSYTSASSAGGYVPYGGQHYSSAQTSTSYREADMSAGYSSRYAAGVDGAQRGQPYHSTMPAPYEYRAMQQHLAAKQSSLADTSAAPAGVSAAALAMSGGSGAAPSDAHGTQYGGTDRYASQDALAFHPNNFSEMAGGHYGSVAGSQGGRTAVQSAMGVAGMGDLSTFHNFESFYSDASDPRRT